jgi:hypothetical protein
LREVAHAHIFDHAPAQRADGLLTHRGAPVLRWSVDPLILKTGRPACHPISPGSLHRRHSLALARSALPRKRVRSVALFGCMVRSCVRSGFLHCRGPGFGARLSTASRGKLTRAPLKRPSRDLRAAMRGEKYGVSLELEFAQPHASTEDSKPRICVRRRNRRHPAPDRNARCRIDTRKRAGCFR